MLWVEKMSRKHLPVFFFVGSGAPETNFAIWERIWGGMGEDSLSDAWMPAAQCLGLFPCFFPNCFPQHDFECCGFVMLVYFSLGWRSPAVQLLWLFWLSQVRFFLLGGIAECDRPLWGWLSHLPNYCSFRLGSPSPFCLLSLHLSITVFKNKVMFFWSFILASFSFVLVSSWAFV